MKKIAYLGGIKSYGHTGTNPRIPAVRLNIFYVSQRACMAACHFRNIMNIIANSLYFKIKSMSYNEIGLSA